MSRRRMGNIPGGVDPGRTGELQAWGTIPVLSGTSSAKELSSDVIEISSDEGEEIPTSSQTRTVNNGTRLKRNKDPGSSQGRCHEVIDLTNDSDTEDPTVSPNPSSGPGNASRNGETEDEGPISDDAILTFYEPKGSRKPLRVPSTSGHNQTPRVQRRHALTLGQNSTDAGDPYLPASPTSPTKARIVVVSGESHKLATTPRQPRVGTKKAAVLAEQARREKYAKQVFDELNEKVFQGGLPQDTKLVWNNRLLTTAGRAKWHKAQGGAQTTEIELAIKILDDDARIRNTMAHEMCHLACWVLDKEPNENHGRLFKSWASKVTRKMPHIKVTTKHSYDINHPYEWKCDQCSKVYGRFSKSIRPEECVCGACRVGRLLPQFAVRGTPKTPAKPSTIKTNASKTGGDVSGKAPPTPGGWASTPEDSDPEQAQGRRALVPENPGTSEEVDGLVNLFHTIVIGG